MSVLPDQNEADQGQHGMPVSPSHGNTTMDMEQIMREQIRILQEQRAAVMMNEVIELQRERDLALGRVKSLKKCIEDLTMENALLKGAVGRGDVAEKLLFLERSNMEEQLLANDLRKKLQTANKQNSTLMLKVRKLEMEAGTSQWLKPPGMGGGEGERERSHSLTDLNVTISPVSASSPDTNSQASSTTTTPRNGPEHQTMSNSNVLSNGKKLSPPLLSVYSSQCPSVGVRSGSTTPQTYSPTVIPRRYKLAAAVCRDAGTQTTPAGRHSEPHEEDTKQTNTSPEVPSDVLNILESAKRDILKLQQEKEHLEAHLTEQQSQRLREKEKLSNLKKEHVLLKTECSVLKGSLSEFSLWTRQKMQLMEEDMDIFKVVYSLHGSLSQEKAMLNDLRDKLTKADSKINRLESANNQLKEEVTQTEDKYKQCKKDLKRLREKHSFSTSPPPPSSTPPYYRSPSTQRHTIGGRASPSLRKYKSVGLSYEKSSSPLLSRTSPPMKAMFPVRVANSKDRRQDVV